ncbi:MAG: hypothetical protein IPK30_12145 [Cellvibrionales bacterium]|nr:hypothetical protein [Cellvibrionales bacterium]
MLYSAPAATAHHATAYAAAIDAINHSGLPVLALDLPSGIDAGAGCAEGVAVAADVTITFVALKRGLLTADAPDFTGLIEYAGLGAEELDAPTITHCERLKPGTCQDALPPRQRTAHKGLFGHVMVIGG